MKFAQIIFALSIVATLFAGCKKNETSPKLIFKFKFDPTQQRLNGFGQPDSTMPANHAGQSPSFNAMSAHYIELAQGPLTPLGTGAVLYTAAETTVGGSRAIDFSKSSFAKDGEMFYEIPLKDVAAGNYQYLRVSLAYQNYDVMLLVDTSVNVAGTNYPIYNESPCTVASFIGYNTYVAGNYKVKNQNISAPGNHAQGYWGFEYSTSFYGYPYNLLTSGQAPAGSTTVVNPLFATSPIPAGSCLATGAFAGGNLQITGNETKDVVVTVSLSTNKSFEWVEVVNDGKWEPTKGETIVDMGVRGLIPSVQY
jgi:hypothetical protein